MYSLPKTAEGLSLGGFLFPDFPAKLRSFRNGLAPGGVYPSIPLNANKDE
jgi:hypothetical protein